MIVYGNSIDCRSIRARKLILETYPILGRFFIFRICRYKFIRIKSTNLHISSVISEAYTKLSLCNKISIIQCIINGHLILSTQTSSPAQSQNPISNLIIKQISFLVHTSEHKLKTIIIIKLISEIHQIFYHKP